MNPSEFPAWGALPESARRVYLELLRYGPAPRAELAERVGLSPASLTRVTAPLLNANLIVEGEPRAGEFGRPSIPLDVALDAYSLIGVSITHEWVVAIATDARLNVRTSRTLPVTDTTPSVLLPQVADLVQELERELQESSPNSRVAAVGLSIGGQIDDARTVRHAPFLHWDNVPAAERLEDATGLPVVLTHDLTALAEAENWFGIGRENERFIVITVGVGTGFALVINHRVITDENTGFGTITDPILGPDWPNFTEPSTLTERELTRAARLVGRFAGTAAAFTMPQGVVISGEGAHLLAGHEEELDAGIAEVRHRSASGLDIHLREHDFAFWARGAATAAIQWVLGHAGPLSSRDTVEETS